MFDLLTFTPAPVLAAWSGPGWWIVFVPLGWFLVIFTFFFLFRRAGWGPGCWWGYAGRGEFDRRFSPSELLERRFAQGDLTVEEYRSRKAVLEEKRGGPGSEARWPWA